MKSHDENSGYGYNIYKIKNPERIDDLCLYAVVKWYNEIDGYDFDNPRYSLKTGNHAYVA